MVRIELTESELQADLDDLYQRYVLLPVQPGEFTHASFGARYGLSHGAVEGAFARMQAAGEIEQVTDADGQPVLRNVRGHKTKVYRRRTTEGAR